MQSDIPANLETTCLEKAKEEHQEAQQAFSDFINTPKEEVIAELREQHRSMHAGNVEAAANMGGYRMAQLKDTLEIENLIHAAKGVNNAIPDILNNALEVAKLDRDEIQKDI